MFEIVSYQSAGPLRFGMNPEEVATVVGHPQSISNDPDGELGYEFGKFIARIAPTQGLVEVGFAPVVPVFLGGLDIFSTPGAFKELVQKDGLPFEFVGFIILLNLGITLTGFHDEEPSDRAVTAFAKGRWDHLRPNFKEYHISK